MTEQLVGVSLKAYLGVAETKAWLAEVRRQLADTTISLFICPPFPLLSAAVELLAGTDIAVGSQDVSEFRAGAHTGDVVASVVVELGGRFGEIGHAERTRDHGETDDQVAAKALRCAEVGLIPVLCVGEPERRVDPSTFVSAQLNRRLAHLPRGCEVVIAYEPVWAIGADGAAEPAYIGPVVATIRQVLSDRGLRGRVLYGGSAGEGLYPAIYDACERSDAAPDGLFIGRAALDVNRLKVVVDEVARSGGDRGH